MSEFFAKKCEFILEYWGGGGWLFLTALGWWRIAVALAFF